MTNITKMLFLVIGLMILWCFFIGWTIDRNDRKLRSCVLIKDEQGFKVFECRGGEEPE